MTGDLNQVRGLEEARLKAMARNDAQALADLCSEQLIYTHGTARRDSKEQLVLKIRRGTYVFQEIDADTEAIVIVNDTACIAGVVSFVVVVDGQKKTLRHSYLSVWCRSDGVWQFLAYQPTPMSAVAE